MNDTNHDHDSDPIGKDAPAFGSEDMSGFEAAIRRRMQGNWSLASDVWRLEDETMFDDRPTVVFHHRDSISRIQLSTTGGWIDADIRVEVFRPLPKEEAAAGHDEDINDITVTDKTLDLLGEAVWFAEYFARTADERIPEDPATNLHGPVDADAEEVSDE